MPTTQPNKTLLRVQKHQSVKSDDMSFKANVYHQNLKVIKKVTHRMLARLYLMMLYIIFPIYVNFPNWSRCNLKAIIHRKKTVNCSMLLEKVFFSERWFWWCSSQYWPLLIDVPQAINELPSQHWTKRINILW